jgi:hypothetical protein
VGNVSVAPGSASQVTTTSVSVTCSAVVPWNFTNGRPVASALATLVQGIVNEHITLSEPPGSTYATSASVAHEPSGRHASDAQSVCATQAWHVSSAPQMGVVPEHAVESVAVHSTQVEVAVSQTAVGAVQSLFVVHCTPASTSGPAQLGSVGWLLQNSDDALLQAPKASPIREAIVRARQRGRHALFIGPVSYDILIPPSFPLLSTRSSVWFTRIPRLGRRVRALK